jgi:hypothetical protein
MDDVLPPDLVQGPPRLLTYRVTVQNRAAKAADPSAPAFAAAGAAPPPVAGFSATPRRNGIVLAWQPADSPATLRVDRTRTSAPPAEPEKQPTSRAMGRKAPEDPAEQVLRIAESASVLAPDHLRRAIDATAHTGNSYRYVAQRVAQVAVNGHDLQIASIASPPIAVDFRDIFPPPVPTGLVSASDSAAKSIDLDWTPDVDPGLAGYIVYRRPAGSSQPPQRVSPPGKPVTSSNWSDTTAQPGQRYAYSVTAIDTSGNESERSAEVVDEWNTSNPQP